MFKLLAILLVLAILFFGAVQPHVYLILGIITIGGVAVFLVSAVSRSGRIPTATLAWLLSMVAVYSVSPKSAVSVFMVGWTWLAMKAFPSKALSFLNFLMVLGLCESILGLIQYFVLPGWIFGYQNLTYISTGTLINRNHYAGLLEMILPTSVGLSYIAFHRIGDGFRTYVHLLAGALIAIGIILSASRMGILAGFATLVVIGSALRFKHASKASTLLILVLIGIVLMGSLWIGIDAVLGRYAELAGPDALIQEGRLVIFSDTVKMILTHPLGIGLGNYGDTFRQYQTYRPDLLVDHAHNDYLETASEWGVLFAGAFWISLFVLVARGFRRFARTESIERSGILIASLGAIVSILFHSLTDFNLQIPGNAMTFCTFIGILLAASSKTPIPPWRSSQPESS